MGRGPSIAARKGVEDARRGKLFTKFIREITVAARTGGGDPKSNARLRLALDGRNLLHAQHVEYVGGSEIPRSVLAALQWRF